ncbi:hypothetical protein CCAX7_006170 [Capsulimonas corticalis]|uniref:Uncharacterized protein n=1 Tax=Capsulimonas corticalis TaxID=2219043 RepID=A0A402D3C2_9BACT|nr:hypothetical protein [Capsulimonas corticalis]BDI28566.1 hypothetical protein CCAX7_006170 [Capsulimonas corticalis]
MAYDDIKDDNVQHGIDDNPTHDAEKGAGLGAVGGAIVGGLAGGPVGAIIGAVAGGIASGAAVAAVDRHDNDNTVSGLGDGATSDLNDPLNDDVDAIDPNLPAGGRVGVYNTPSTVPVDNSANAGYDTTGRVGNGVPGVQTGGYDVDGTPDTRGITEKAADAITGDRIDDKTGKPVV